MILLLGLLPRPIYIKDVIQRKIRLLFLSPVMWALGNCLHSRPDFLADTLSDRVLLSGPGKEEEKREKVNVITVSGMRGL